MPLPFHDSRLVIHFRRFGPYHLARLASAHDGLAAFGWDIVGLETASYDATYEWALALKDAGLQRVTVFPECIAEQIHPLAVINEFINVLDRLQPIAVAIAGWSQSDALACLNWCRRNGVKAILMSETREADGDRSWWKEILKARLVSRFDSALVGGSSHQAYIRKLGFQGPIRTGYDVVDDRFFAVQAERWRLTQRDATCQLRPYLLASNRFIPRKNLSSLIEAFAHATALCKAHTSVDLCLLGDGEQRRVLEARCTAYGLTTLPLAPWDDQACAVSAQGPRVFFPGFRQIDELPRFYAHALGFVHPALAEPWGLVINEAMAAGLPILSSGNVGAAEDLLVDGVNGYRFDPSSTASITQALSSFLTLTTEQRQQMGRHSQQLLSELNPTSSFGEGLASLLCGDST
jgi:1,2-diacylglycerol 3-alpha-glucosyltransferase